MIKTGLTILQFIENFIDQRDFLHIYVNTLTKKGNSFVNFEKAFVK